MASEIEEYAETGGEMVSYRVDGALVTKEEYELLRAEVDVPKFTVSLWEQDITKEAGMFIYDPFGRGSTLEQAVQYIVGKVLLNKPMSLAYLSIASRLLNEIIDREMKMRGLVIEERFLFESMNEYGKGGWMRVHDTTGRTYLSWSI
jgi:hypothetical protein